MLLLIISQAMPDLAPKYIADMIVEYMVGH